MNFDQHRARCPPPPPPPPGDAAELTRNTSAPQSISDGFSVVSVSASVGGSEVVSRDESALEPSEVSSAAPSSPPRLDATVVATRRSQDTDTVECVPHSCSDLRCVELGPSPYSSDSISDRVSVSRDTAGTPVSVRLSVTENFDDPDDARALQDSPEPPKAGVKVCAVFSRLRGSSSSPLTLPSLLPCARLASLIGEKQSAIIEQRSCYPDHGHNDARRRRQQPKAPSQEPYYSETETPVLPLQILSRGPLRQTRRDAVRAHLLPQVPTT